MKLPKRHDRELIELLTELRVVLPGVQVLFAFLLVVPFSARFGAKGDDVSTEDLRVVLTRYRSFFDRLLSA